MIGYLWITAATEKKVKYANFVYIYVKINTEIEKKTFNKFLLQVSFIGLTGYA